VSGLTVTLGLAWGALAASPLAFRAQRAATVARATSLATARRRTSFRLPRLALPPAVAGVVSSFAERRRARRREAEVVAELPVVIDLLAVAVGAGCTPYLAVSVAATWSPPAMAARLRAVRRACDLGSSFSEALDRAAADVPPLAPLVDALLSSDRFGAPVADALGRLATEERAALRRRAETRARTVPVRLLFPLVFLVLPAFGLLTVAPALLSGLGRA
jgi:tight adherence protein C